MRALGEVTNPTGRLPAKEFDNRFRFHTAAQRWAAGMEAETPPLTGGDRQTGCFHFGNNHRSLPGLGPRWFGLCGSQTKGLPSWPGSWPSGSRPQNFRQVTFRTVLLLPGAVSMVLAALVVSQFPRRSWERPEQQTRPSPRFKLLRAASIGEAALIFSTAPAPRGEQAKAADSLPKRDRKAAHRAVPVTTKEVTGIDSNA